MNETILVVGACGNFAGLVVPELARRGADIRAADVEAHTLGACGHFMTEERPAFVIEHIRALGARVAARTIRRPVRA